MTKQTKNKFPAWVVAVLISLGVVAALVFYDNNNQPVDNPASNSIGNSQQFKQEYPRVNDDNRFVYVSGDDALELFDSGTGLVFLGFKECPWCQQLAPIAEEAAKAEDLDKIYYLDIRQARADNSETYQKLVDYLEPHLEKDEKGEPRIFVPDVSALRDGEIVGRFKQESTADGERVTPESFWTAERRERGVEQLREMIRKM